MFIRQRQRRGAATVELALLLPFLLFMFLVVTDWARAFYHSQIVTTCARNGALYACDPTTQSGSPYSSITQAALADASNLSPTPTVTSKTGSDAGGAYVEVTVSSEFRTITNFPGVPHKTTLVRTVRMRVLPLTPN